MANEAILRDRFSDPVDFTCYDTPAMTRGSILTLSGARLVGLSATSGVAVAGILARDKISGDGRTQVPVYIDGIFDCYFDSALGPAVTIGSQVVISGANILKRYATLDEEKGYVLGKILEAGAVGYCQVQVGVE